MTEKVGAMRSALMSYLEWKASRTEFIIVDNEPYVRNEHCPGLTSESLLPQQSIAAEFRLKICLLTL
jgi:hypothetical protein